MNLRRTGLAIAGTLPAFALVVVFGAPWPILILLCLIYALLAAWVFHAVSAP